MTKTVGVHEAKTHLSRLLEDVESGVEVVITRRGRAVAKLTPAERRQPVFGKDRGKFEVPEDFDDPMPDWWLDLFYNAPIEP